MVKNNNNNNRSSEKRMPAVVFIIYLLKMRNYKFLRQFTHNAYSILAVLNRTLINTKLSKVYNMSKCLIVLYRLYEMSKYLPLRCTAYLINMWLSRNHLLTII